MSAKVAVFVAITALCAIIVLTPISQSRAEEGYTERELLIMISKGLVTALIETVKLENRIEKYRTDNAKEKSPEWRKLQIIENKMIENVGVSCYYGLRRGFKDSKICMRLCQEPYPLSQKQYENDLYLCELRILGTYSDCRN